MTLFRVAAAALISFATGALAQDITLTSHDGKVEITGNLLGFDGEFYRVETQFGPLTVDGSGVTCDGPACPNLTDFVAELWFSGSSVMAETVLPALIIGFAQQENLTATPARVDSDSFVYELRQADRSAPLARFYFDVGTTARGFRDLVAGQTDIVMAQREVRESEREEAEATGLGDLKRARRSRVIALDAMVPVVAADSMMQQISMADLARVLSGDVTNWMDLGGPDAPIALHVPEMGSGLAQAVEDQVLKTVDAELSPTAIPHSRIRDLTDAVAKDPFSIGIASKATADGTRPLPLTGGCGHPLAATRQSIKTEDYPLTLPMFLYLPDRRLPRIARQFLAYTQGPGAQMAIRGAGYVDQSPETLPIGVQGDRLANAIVTGGAEVELEELQRMIDTLRPLSRLSLSVRFEPGSSRPDAQSRSNIQHLAQMLETGTLKARKLVFAGFSDGDGGAAANARIALRRAQTVRNTVLAAMESSLPEGIEISAEGFGEAMPMACDDTEWGRKVNRRVEIWVQ
ncbi:MULTISPECIES: phosphate ABC transporter substrate-binding/OmpA family protein [unclassified Ruegeria]|uniref:phosphate ABC transporter substrate-binding/OmpA family protein n=1 Tax=unclassified Ruegeria TaxID=2625375 RepID=UPI001488C381|nr:MULTISPECIES: phosphate ABC transporter substrate-binding/OmpA family protein [unclassified Ruegeria]NOD76129.1 OmpA family protein [Ruegeria sp. HKCCD4332]